MTFSSVTILEFTNTKLFKASNTPGGGFVGYGSGTLRLNFIKTCDSDNLDIKGRVQMTYHNDLTCVCGLNTLIVSNFCCQIADGEHDRVGFKALSEVSGTNRKRNMYNVKLASSADAGRLCYVINLVQHVAKQADEADSEIITLPDLHSAEATAARSLIGSNQESVERFLVWTRLVQLAQNEDGNEDLLSTYNNSLAKSLFTAPFLKDRTEENTSYQRESFDTGDSGSLQVASVDVDGGSDDDDSDESAFPESQDWKAAFFKE